MIRNDDIELLLHMVKILKLAFTELQPVVAIILYFILVLIMRKVAVLGAGINGLSCAVKIKEKHPNVNVS